MLFHIAYYNLYIFLSLIAILVLTLMICFERRRSATEKPNNDISEYVSNLINTINSVRYGNLLNRLDVHPDSDLNEVSKCINRMIETLNDREKMILEYQSEMKRKNESLENVINSLSDGLVILDENNIIIQATKNINKWFAYKNKLTGKDINKFIKIPDDINLKELNDNEIFVIKNDCNNFIASVVPLEDETLNSKYLLIIKDVTNRIEIEKLKEDFVATLTHDLKVPIVAESNVLQFLLSEKFGELNDKQKEVIQNMQTSNKELLDLVHVVLDTYRLKDNKIELNKERVSLKAIINDVISEVYSLAEVSNNKIIIFVDDDIEYELDILQFKRVLKNLIHNAISYGKENSDIEIKLIKEKSRILLKVKDYGSGIAADDINKIFNKYYSAAKKFRKIGTGLGLYLSKKIIEAHSGFLNVVSEEGKYTEFCIELPL